MHTGRGARTCTAGHPPARGRGLCTGCRQAAWRAGTLDQHARRQWSRDELLDEWVALRAGGVRFVDFPHRVGVTQAAWEQAWGRAFAAGDERVVRAVREMSA
jgi:hypothetical protein